MNLSILKANSTNQTGGFVSPKPVRQPRPILVNAGQSDAGIDFATKHCEWAFCNASPLGTREQLKIYAERILDRAAHHGRRVRPVTFAYVIMADTDEQALEIADWVKEEVDEEAADTFIARATGKQGWSGAVGGSVTTRRVCASKWGMRNTCAWR